MRQRTAVEERSSWGVCAETALRSAWKTPGCWWRHELTWTGPRVGRHAFGPDGSRYAVFRQTGRRAAGIPAGRADRGELVILGAWFRLPWLGRPGSWRHRLFRRVCIVTVPLFSGLEGYRTKLWLYEVDGDRYLGIYEWDGAEGGRAYLAALRPLLVALSTRGSVGAELLAGEALDRVMKGPTALRAGSLRGDDPLVGT